MNALRIIFSDRFVISIWLVYGALGFALGEMPVLNPWPFLPHMLGRSLDVLVALWLLGMVPKVWRALRAYERGLRDTA